MTMICIALASCRWSIDFLIDEFGPFEFETSLGFYALALLEFYLVVFIAAFSTFLGFRLSRRSNQIIPLFVTAGIFAVVSGWIWFTPPDRWFVIGFLWFAAVFYSWAIILPVRYIRQQGYALYAGRKKLG